MNFYTPAKLGLGCLLNFALKSLNFFPFSTTYNIGYTLVHSFLTSSLYIIISYY